MEQSQREEAWTAGDLYEPYVGRWSRQVAREFLGWLGVANAKNWLDVGCGTGALTQTILDHNDPQSVKGVDSSPRFLEDARARVSDRRVQFEVGDAQALPIDAATFDAAVSGLMLNFVPHPLRAVTEMARVVQPGGVVAAYVWDYAGKMELMRYFWDAAAALDPAAHELDEGRRFPICNPEPLTDLFLRAWLLDVEVRAIDVPTVFRDFEDFWSPFLGGQGPAPGYAVSLSDERRAVLRDRVAASLPIRKDGAIHLVARAWAVQGRVPDRAAGLRAGASGKPIPDA